MNTNLPLDTRYLNMQKEAEEAANNPRDSNCVLVPSRLYPIEQSSSYKNRGAGGLGPEL